ncbi:MAG: hypothetical protein HY903_04315 [Deltaproteobacteria bacterium]|nr:hypothetical protein [Deltaproteobacteria bacterium]
MLSNLGANTMIFSLNFSRIATNDERPAARDYPGCASFFEIPAMDQVLDAASSTTGPFFDLSSSMPSDKDWHVHIEALTDSTWDQGAMWSNGVFVYRPPAATTRQVFTLYEAWGAELVQPNETRYAMYAGSLRLWALGESADLSCHQRCGDRKSQGEKCLSASIYGPGSAWHGADMPHEMSLAAFVAAKGNDPLIERALYVCSDMGTMSASDGTFDQSRSDIAPIEISVSTISGGVKLHGDQGCTARGYAGFVWAEHQGDTLVNQGEIPTGQPFTVYCSSRYPTSRFSNALRVADRQTSCDSHCQTLGAGPDGIGFRPYHVEARLPQGALDSVNMDPDFVLDLANTWTASFPYVQDAADEIVCVCGPGRNLRAVMAARRATVDPW